MARILVLGAGFAGLWAAVGAARKLDEIGVLTGEVEILVVDRNPYHNIRVRNYEIDLDNVAIPLGEVLDPIGISHLTAEVRTIDVAKQQVVVATRGDRRSWPTIASCWRLAVNWSAQIFPDSRPMALTWTPIQRRSDLTRILRR